MCGTLSRVELMGDGLMKETIALTHWLWDCTTVLTFCRPACAVTRSHCRVGHPRTLVLPSQNSALCPWGCLVEGMRCGLFVCVVLNYRACLLFNRSAERVMPQPMSPPSCIIAPVCHCHRLGKASSDCFSPLSPPHFSFHPPVFSSLPFSLHSH